LRGQVKFCSCGIARKKGREEQVEEAFFVEPRPSALSYAAEGGTGSCRPISAAGARGALSSKPAVRPPTIAAGVDRWDRRPDGRTDTPPLHRPCSGYYAASVKNNVY